MKKFLVLLLLTPIPAMAWTVTPFNTKGEHVGYIIGTTAENSNASLLIFAGKDGGVLIMIQSDSISGTDLSKIAVTIDGQKVNGDLKTFNGGDIDGLIYLHQDMGAIMAWVASTSEKYEITYSNKKTDVFDLTGFSETISGDSRLVPLIETIMQKQAELEQLSQAQEQ